MTDDAMTDDAMTDDAMDARLRAAGDRWRATNSAVVEAPQAIDEIEIRSKPTPTPTRRFTHRWVTAASAAIVAAALVVAGVAISRNSLSGNSLSGKGSSDTPNGTNNETAAGLIGTTWTLAGTPGATLRIASDGTLTGNDGCNTLGGRAKITGDKLTLLVSSTEMYCPGTRTDKTDQILSGTVTWSVSGDRLMLSKPHVGSLTYRVGATARPVTAPSRLIGISWHLIATQSSSGSGADAAVSNSSAVSSSVVVFDGNGGFTVAHRCYTDRGTARLGDGSARLSGVTLKSAIPCASNAESVSGQHENDLVDAVLTGTVAWSISGTQLTISKGGTGLTFARS